MKTDGYASGMADHTIRGVPRVWVEGRSTLLCPLRRPISRRQPEKRRSRAFSQRSGAQQARKTQSENRAEYTYGSVQQSGSTSSYLYELFSDFGSSTPRPFLRMLALYAVSFGFIFTTDNPETALKDSEYLGWRVDLLRQNCIGRLSRSAMLAVQLMINLVGVIRTRSLLVARHSAVVS